MPRLGRGSLDHRGHGESPGPEGSATSARAAGTRSCRHRPVHRLARRPTPASRQSLRAQHGFGRGPATGAGCLEEIAALILSGSSGWAAAGRAAYVLHAERRRTGANPVRVASRDPAEVDRYIADPYCGFETRNCSAAAAPTSRLADFTGWHASATTCRASSSPGRRTHQPGYGLSRTPAPERSGRQADRHPTTRTAATRWNETNRDEVTADIGAWIKRLRFEV